MTNLERLHLGGSYEGNFGRSMRGNVNLVYQLSISSRTEENLE